MPTHEQIVAMAVATIAEETRSDASRIRVVSFARVHKTGLERYVEEHDVAYHKYSLEDEVR